MGLFGGRQAAGFEVGQRALRAAALNRGGRPGIAWVSQVDMPQGILLNSFTEPNIADMPAFVRLLERLFEEPGRKAGRVNVALPDHVSRISVLEFDSLQGKQDETEQMLRWRLKKLLPFDVEQASMRYQYLGRFASGEKDQHRFLVSIIKSDILEQYQQAFSEAGIKAGSIDLASFCVWNLYEEFIVKDAADMKCFSVMNLSGGKLTVMVFERGVPHFFRLKDLGAQNGDGEEESATRVLKELNASLTFYKENFGGSTVERAYITGDAPGKIKQVADEAAGNSALKTVVLEPAKVVEQGSAKVEAAGTFGAAMGAALED